MGDVLVRNAAVSDGRITTLDVDLHGLPSRSIDRDTAVAWMRDGHSFVPVDGDSRKPALVLVEVGDEVFIRADAKPEAADQL